MNKKTVWAIAIALCLIFVLGLVTNGWAAVGTKRQKRKITVKSYDVVNKYIDKYFYSTRYNDNHIYKNNYNFIDNGNVYHWSNLTTNTSEVHKIISGSARAQTQNGGNWWDNDWNHMFDANGNLLAIHNLAAHKVGYTSDERKALKEAGIFKTKKEIHNMMASGISSDQQAWLESLTKKKINFDEKTMYYFDLTSKTWKQGPYINNVSSKDINDNTALAQDWHNAAKDFENYGFKDNTTSRVYDRETGRWEERTSSTSTSVDVAETGRKTEETKTYEKDTKVENTLLDTQILDPYTEIEFVLETTVNTFTTNHNYVTTIFRDVTHTTTTNETKTTHINMQHVTENHTVDYQLAYYVFDNSPLILDLDKNGKLDTAMNDWRPHAPKFYIKYAKYFDITGDGVEDFTEWVASSPQDGLLVVPQNGKVLNALHLFGTAGGYIDGYEKLSLHFDLDGNGWVEGNELKGLKIWVDANNDAVCQDNELKELSQYNIKKICVNHKDYVSKYETDDGQQYTMWDWWPAAAETRKVKR